MTNRERLIEDFKLFIKCQLVVTMNSVICDQTSICYLYDCFVALKKKDKVEKIENIFCEQSHKNELLTK